MGVIAYFRVKHFLEAVKLPTTGMYTTMVTMCHKTLQSKGPAQVSFTTKTYDQLDLFISQFMPTVCDGYKQTDVSQYVFQSSHTGDELDSSSINTCLDSFAKKVV